MEFASDRKPGPNLAEALTTAGVPTEPNDVRWRPANSNRSQSVIELVNVEEGSDAAGIAAGVIDSYIPADPVQPGPSLEERLAAVEAWIVAHDAEG